MPASMQSVCQVVARDGMPDACSVAVVEVPTGHRCMLGAVAERVARVTDPAAALEEARRALDELLADREFDRCCVPHYVASAARDASEEVEIPVAERGPISVRVIVWPIGSRDVRHPHTDGWTVFSVARGHLTVTEERDAERR